MARGYNNIDQAVVLPKSDYAAYDNMLFQRQQQRTRDAEAKKLREQARADSLTAMVGKEFDDKDYMTGTAADPFINQKLSEIRNKYASQILKNPNISAAELSMGMQKDVGNIASTSSAFKAANAAITDLTKDFDKAKGIDGGAIRKLAFNNILYTTDPKTGQKRMRTAEELQAVVPAEEVDRIIKEHPEVYLDESTAFESGLAGYKTWKTGNTFGTEQGGVSRKVSYAGTLYPFQQIKRDPVTGKEVLDNTGKVQVEVKSKKAVLDGKPVTINGQEIDVMDDEIYDRWIGNKANNAVLNQDLKRFNAENAKKGLPAIQDGTPEADIIKNHSLYKRLKDQKPPDFDTKDLTEKDAYRSKVEQGWNPAAIGSAIGKELAKKDAADAKLQATDFGTIFRAAGLDGGVVDAASKETVDGKSMLNITGTVGGIKLGFRPTDPLNPSGPRTAIIGDLYIDPTNPGAVTVKDRNGKKKTYKDAELGKFLKSVAGYNGISVTKVEELIKLNTDGSGKLKKVDRETKVALGSEAREENFKAEKFKAAGTAAIEGFKSTGNAASLKPFVGKTGLIGGVTGTITRIDTKPSRFWGSGTAVITYTGPDGTLGTFEVKNPTENLPKLLESFINK